MAEEMSPWLLALQAMQGDNNRPAAAMQMAEQSTPYPIGQVPPQAPQPPMSEPGTPPGLNTVLAPTPEPEPAPQMSMPPEAAAPAQEQVMQADPMRVQAAANSLADEDLDQLTYLMNKSQGQFDQALQVGDQNLAEARMAEQQEIDRMKETLAKYQSMNPGFDYRPLAAFVDARFGGGGYFSKAAQAMAPESEAERAMNINAMQTKIAGAQSKLTGSELDAYKNQLVQQGYMSQRQADMLIEKLKLKAGGGKSQGRHGKEFLKERQDARDEGDVQKLEKRIGNMVPGVVSKLENLNSLIPGGIDSAEGDIEGIGPGMVFVPDVMLSEKGSAIRRNAEGLVADLLKIQTGATATDTEVKRKMNEYGMGETSKSSTFKLGLQNVRKQVALELKNKEAGFRPGVQELYRNRGGLSHRDVLSIRSGNAPTRSVPGAPQGTGPGGAMSFEEWKKSRGQ